jgi:hypothetical protein
MNSILIGATCYRVESVSLEPASSLSGETVTVELPDLLHLSIRTWSIENLDLTCPNLRSLHVSYVNYVDVQTIIDNHSLLENITIQSVGTDSELTFNLDKLRCIRLRYLVNLERCEVVTPCVSLCDRVHFDRGLKISGTNRR